MQTFLPYPDFVKSAKVLDYRRLGKQRVEVLQLLNSFHNPDYKGWKNHPAREMWRGYEYRLVLYGVVMAVEWVNRGYNSTIIPKLEVFLDCFDICENPPWVGDEKFHSAHRAALLYKEPEHYRQFGWKEEPKLDYLWPTCDDTKSGYILLTKEQLKDIKK